MSGAPYPEGVKRVVELVKRKAELRAECDQLRDKISNDRTRLDILGEEWRKNDEEFATLMRQMDVASAGNYGWEQRIGWFLAEMQQQLDAAGTSK